MYGKPGKSSCKDRSQEFLSTVETFKKASPSGNAPSSSGPKGEGSRSTASIQSEFNKRASNIGFGIHETSQKLAKLAKLAKKTSSPYDDPTMEIQELTSLIKQDITALSSAVVELQLLCNSQKEEGVISSDTTNHSTTVVNNLKVRLTSATKEFKEVLTKRTENLKVHENRRQLFSSQPGNPFIRHRPLAVKSSSSSSSPALPPWADQSTSSSSPSPGERENEESQPMLQKQMVQRRAAPMQDSYMQSRAEALENVESTIQELGTIFTQLATMVSEQAELALRIDENMEETLGNVEGAQGQLIRYLNGISSNRWLMIKVFFVLIAFLMIFVFFVA